MRMRSFLGMIFLSIFLFSSQSAYALISSEELLKRLNELGDVIQKQQHEIERLKDELMNQKESIHDVRESQEKKIQEAVKAEVKEKEKTWWDDRIPKWATNIKVSGDLRLRYEARFNCEERQVDGSKQDLPTRDRYRIRARLFFDGKINDEISAHFMICTNSDKNREATTTNQSFSDDFNDKSIYLHRAYATYKPQWLNGLEVTAGKFKNTFFHTDIMWDPDVNPEGIYEKYQYNASDSFRPYIHLGQMIVNEVSKETDDAALYINQLGVDWKIGPVKCTFAGSYYDWSNLHNTEYLHNADYKGGGGNTFIEDRNGNLQYRYDYNLVEALSSLKFKLGVVPTKLMFNYIVNKADDVPGDADTAYFAGFKLGREKKKGDCSFFYKYAHIEKDSVLGSMNDQDFYGANRKGHKLVFRYMIFDKLRFGTAFFYTDPITAWDPGSVTFGKNKSREHEDRFQTDFVFKF